MKVPGATISGFKRLSSVGPLLENAANPLILSASLSVLTGGEYLVAPQVLVKVGRSFSLAPTVSTFFALAGAPRESRSTSPSEFESIPLFPAEKRIVMFGYWRAEMSACMDEVV